MTVHAPMSAPITPPRTTPMAPLEVDPRTRIDRTAKDFEAAALPEMSAVAKPRTAPMSPQEASQRARIDKTAKEFEASFLSAMMGQMFNTLPTDGPFSGGQAEQTMRSFMTDAFGKSMSQRGGIGLAPAIKAQMLKMQGLS